jgi:hypothetical protein
VPYSPEPANQNLMLADRCRIRIKMILTTICGHPGWPQKIPIYRPYL